MAIERIEDPELASRWAAQRRAEGASLGLVPTMGALHEGHLELVQRAVDENDLACVSVFVNPLQFDQAHDLANYPRDLDRDTELLDSVGCRMVFTGTLEGFFPGSSSAADIPRVDPGPAALGMEGACRLGHFDGVATIVARLFELIVPARAYFGAKDYQQTLVAAHVAAQMQGPEVVVGQTSRDPDGLARSSRNLLLEAGRRDDALALSRSLLAAGRLWASGERRASKLRAAMLAVLNDASVEVEYAEVRDPENWTRELGDEPLLRARALVAAHVGQVRLLDNMDLDEVAAALTHA